MPDSTPHTDPDVPQVPLQAAGEEPPSLPQAELDRLTDALVDKLKTVFDPEIPVDISDNLDVAIDMTLTAPGCPVAGEMPEWVRDAVMEVDGIRSCTVELVFEPPWDASRMSDEAKLALNMF